MTPPFLGKYGAVGIAAQTAVGTAATKPTLWLNVTQFAAPQPTLNYSTDATADGTIDASDDRLQGVTNDARQISFNPTMQDLPQLLAWALGTAASGATAITRRTDNFGALAPGVPLTVFQLHPTGHTVMKDAQISQIQVTQGNRATAVCQLTFMGSPRPFTIPTGTNPGPLDFVPAPSLTDTLQFIHWYLKYAGGTLRPAQGTVTINIPMEVEDGAQGTDPTNALYAIGYERSGGVEFTVDWTSGQPDSAFLAGLFNAYQGGVNAAIVTGWAVGAKTVELTATKAKIKTANPGTDLGRIQVPYQARAQRNLPGNNFDVNKIPTVP